jgi:hypothetical protein
MYLNDNLHETYCTNESDFFSIASKYGEMIRSRREGGFIDQLSALMPDDVGKDSLTKRFGLNEFPIHTDCAYFKQPPKFILLRYVGEIEAPSPTVIVHFDKANLSEAELGFITRAIWYVKGYEGGFYTTILKNNIIRYDKQIMRLVNSHVDLMPEILEKMDTEVIAWKQNKVAIINNHNLLHYRPALGKNEYLKRKLQRIIIK